MKEVIEFIKIVVLVVRWFRRGVRAIELKNAERLAVEKKDTSGFDNIFNRKL